MNHVITVRDLVWVGFGGLIVCGLIVCGVVASGLWFLAQLNSDV